MKYLDKLLQYFCNHTIRHLNEDFKIFQDQTGTWWISIVQVEYCKKCHKLVETREYKIRLESKEEIQQLKAKGYKEIV